jgi:hypothetical protein
MGYPLPTDIALQGPFAPMRFEATVEECIVSQGEVPKELSGGFYRVGPTWKRPTQQGTNPLLSMDGMVQGLILDNGRADFRNRWVRTPKYLLEDKHQRGMFAWSDGGFHDWRDFAYGDVERTPLNCHTPQGTNNINIFPFAGEMIASGEHGAPTRGRRICRRGCTRRSPTATQASPLIPSGTARPASSTAGPTGTPRLMSPCTRCTRTAGLTRAS